MVWAATALYSTVLPANVVKVPVAAVYSVPPNCNNPAPVNCIVLLVPVPFTFHVTFTVPVPIVILCPVPPAEPLVNETLAAFKVPAPASRIFTPGEVDCGMTT